MAVATRSVVVVGSINEDVILEVPRTPEPGETLAAEAVSRSPGGKGANQAVAAARAGAEVTMIGCVGDDPAGERMLGSLREAGVRTDLVAVLAGCATGAAYITVTPDGENTIVIDHGANARLSANDVERHREAVGAAGAMVAQLEVPIATVSAAVGIARAQRARPVVTAAPAQRLPAELLRGLDPLLVNEHEAATVLGEAGAVQDPASAAARLLELGPSSVVITLGARGAVLAQDGGVTDISAVRVDEVVDTTGAGDAFAGALAAALAGGGSLEDAVAAGMSAAAAAVGRPGAR